MEPIPPVLLTTVLNAIPVSIEARTASLQVIATASDLRISTYGQRHGYLKHNQLLTTITSVDIRAMFFTHVYQRSAILPGRLLPE
jgi:hypothetical protein